MVPMLVCASAEVIVEQVDAVPTQFLSGLVFSTSSCRLCLCWFLLSSM